MNKIIASPIKRKKQYFHFGHCDSFYIVTIKNTLIIEETMTTHRRMKLNCIQHELDKKDKYCNSSKYK